MNKPCVVLFILLLTVASLPPFSSTIKVCGATVPPSVYPSTRAISDNAKNGDVAPVVAASTASAQHQSPSQSQPALVANSSQPSPLLVAAFIVGLVAVFGALLSFYWGRRRGRQDHRGRVVERFWAIDLYGAYWSYVAFFKKSWILLFFALFEVS